MSNLELPKQQAKHTCGLIMDHIWSILPTPGTARESRKPMGRPESARLTTSGLGQLPSGSLVPTRQHDVLILVPASPPNMLNTVRRVLYCQVVCVSSPPWSSHHPSRIRDPKLQKVVQGHAGNGDANGKLDRGSWKVQLQAADLNFCLHLFWILCSFEADLIFLNSVQPNCRGLGLKTSSEEQHHQKHQSRKLQESVPHRPSLQEMLKGVLQVKTRGY